tara:strand:+ start:581 stop:823 length:243 start_codon:yes stop_codon:yes gene_type:complete
MKGDMQDSLGTLSAILIIGLSLFGIASSGLGMFALGVTIYAVIHGAAAPSVESSALIISMLLGGFVSVYFSTLIYKAFGD